MNATADVSLLHLVRSTTCLHSPQEESGYVSLDKSVDYVSGSTIGGPKGLSSFWKVLGSYAEAKEPVRLGGIHGELIVGHHASCWIMGFL